MSYGPQHALLSQTTWLPKDEEAIPANVGAVSSAAAPVVNDENAAGASVSAQEVCSALASVHGIVRRSATPR